MAEDEDSIHLVEGQAIPGLWGFTKVTTRSNALEEPAHTKATHNREGQVHSR